MQYININKIEKFVFVIYLSSYCMFGHYPFCCFLIKTQCFGAWIVSPSLEIGTNSIGWAHVRRSLHEDINRIWPLKCYILNQKQDG
jgi:hypothetical protein